MTQLDLNYRSQAEDGIRRSEAHANNLDPGWSQTAFGMLKDFCRERKGCYFTSEDVRRWCEFRNFESPVPKAWGSVMRRALKAGFLKKRGVGIAKQRHGSPCVEWTS